MPSTRHATLETPIEGLWATPPAQLPYIATAQVRSFLLERRAGNVIVYNSPGLTDAADDIRDHGGATRLVINHGHEAMYGRPDLDVPVYVHERDRAETAAGLPVAGTFDDRVIIDDDFEVIPTPGHTPGATSYLWDSGKHRFLFTGDSLWVEHGEWKAVVLGTSDRAATLDSLALIRDLDFDVLVPWAAIKGQSGIDVTSRSQTRNRINAIITRIEGGGNS